MFGGGPSLKEVTPAEAQKMVETGEAVLIDVREPYEYAEVRATGAKLIPLGSVSQRLNEFPTDKDVLLICRSGGRSAQACMIAMQGGHSRVFNVQGGTISWVNSKLPTERG